MAKAIVTVERVLAAVLAVPTRGGWCLVKLPKAIGGGEVFAHRVPADVAAKYKWNECWLRVGGSVDGEGNHRGLNTEEFRGTAAKVAEELVFLALHGRRRCRHDDCAAVEAMAIDCARSKVAA